MIKVFRDSTTADTPENKRQITESDLRKNTVKHINEVGEGMKFIASLIEQAGKDHDNTKLSKFKEFFEALTGEDKDSMVNSKWFEHHATKERHHLNAIKGDGRGVPDDVNLVDIIEFVVDCTMSGMARSGSVYELKLPNEVLQKALKNTTDLVKRNIKLVDGADDIMDKKVE